MGYNRQNLARIRAEYDRKYLNKQNDAERRRLELEGKIPGLWELNRKIASSGSEIMGAVLFASSPEEREQKISEARETNLRLQKERAALLKENGYPEDYMDVHYECELCGDTGYVNTRMCSCMKRALVLAGYESSGIGNLLSEQRFDNFSLDYYRNSPSVYRMMAYNLATLKTFAEQFGNQKSGAGSGAPTAQNNENFLLIGGTGRGKTHLSSAVAGCVIERGFDAYYISAVNLFRGFEKVQFGRGSGSEETMDRCFESDLLIIDDLGTELTNQFTVSVLYDIVDTRVNRQKSTIISTNLNQEELRKRYWDRITSRIFGEYKPLVFDGMDIREYKARNGIVR